MAGLFDPLEIKGLTLKNRIVMPPMANNMAAEDGEVVDRHIHHYVARAEANVGFIMVEHTAVQKSGRGTRTQLGIWDDSHIAGLRRLADAIREAGAVSGVQINHCASRTTSDVIGQQTVSPSGIMTEGDKEQPRALTVDEIEELVEAFAAAARRAAEAGFDVVEIHSSHGYLLNQFLSPLTNQRTDKYGGDLGGRLTVHREVIAAVRKAVGQEYPLFCRLVGEDRVPGGLLPEDSQQAARHLVDAGIDVIDVSGGLGGSRPADLAGVRGFFVPLAEGIKQVVNVPVIGVGNIREAEFADEIIRAGRVDLAAVGRALLADPLWAVKAAEKLGVKVQRSG